MRRLLFYCNFMLLWNLIGSTALPTRPISDKVTELPGVNFQVRFDHYSGYLDAGDENFFHYWFFESQSNVSGHPLIVFLNGGPGCSSLVGSFTECGPFRIKDSGKTLVEYPYAWNKISNIVFIESPAGTGFSYSNRPWNLSDEQSVLKHYGALLSFYEKFPEFRNRPVYLVGQSYASVYVLTLAQYIQKKWSEFPGKLVGMATLNGVFSLPLIISSRFYYNYYHGLLGESQWKKVITDCCQGQPEGRCNVFPHYSNPNSTCFIPVQKAISVGDQGRDPYNIYFECYKPTPGYKDDEECGVPFGNITTRYFDREDFRRSSHIDINRFRNYSFIACSDAAKAKYTMQYLDMTEVVKTVLQNEHKIRVLVMTGDFDSVCNFLGTQWFIDGLNRTLTGERSPIFFNGISQPNIGTQQNYDSLDYVIIRAAGHYAPADRPRETLQVMNSFLMGERNYSIPVIHVDVTPAQLLDGKHHG